MPRAAQAAGGIPAANLLPQQARFLRSRIYAYIRSQGELGATCEEVELALGLSHQTCSARIKELRDHPVHGGRIKFLAGEAGPIKRQTLSRRSAHVYIAII